MHDLARFALSDMVALSGVLRRLGEDSASMEETARRIVRHLYDVLADPRTGERACALARLYKTHPYGDLEPAVRDFARPLLATCPHGTTGAPQRATRRSRSPAKRWWAGSP
jgi:hypothetical protein